MSGVTFYMEKEPVQEGETTLPEDGMPPGNPGFSSLPGRDQMEPSSAKVIQKLARRAPVPGPPAGRGKGLPISKILARTAPHIQKKGRGIQLSPLRFSPAQGFWSWKAAGSKGKTYTVRVKAWKANPTEKMSLRNHPVRCSCTCPFWQWQGPEHWAKVNGYLYRSFRNEPMGTMSAPRKKDPSSEHWSCKHVAEALRKARSFSYNPPRDKRGSREVPSPERVAQRFLEGRVTP